MSNSALSVGVINLGIGSTDSALYLAAFKTQRGGNTPPNHVRCQHLHDIGNKIDSQWCLLRMISLKTALPSSDSLDGSPTGCNSRSEDH